MKYFTYFEIFENWNISDLPHEIFKRIQKIRSAIINIENGNISDLSHEMQGWHKAPFGASYRLHRKWFVDSFPWSLKYSKYLKYLKIQIFVFTENGLNLFLDLCTDCNQIRIAVINVLLPLIFLYFLHILWCSTQIKSKKIKKYEGSASFCKCLLYVVYSPLYNVYIV